eukprot:552398-Pleurochrysis_carterae.AAC.1
MHDGGGIWLRVEVGRCGGEVARAVMDRARVWKGGEGWWRGWKRGGRHVRAGGRAGVRAGRGQRGRARQVAGLRANQGERCRV